MTPAEIKAWLTRKLEWTNQGWTAWIFTDDHAAVETLRDALTQWFAGQDRPFRQVRPTRADELAALTAQVMRMPESLWIEALFEGPRWDAGWIDFISRLNSQRDTLMAPERMVLFVAPQHLKSTLRAAGPDLWSRLARTLDLGHAPTLSAPSSTSIEHLTRAELEELYAKALSAGLADLQRRALLFSWISPTVTSHLPRMAAPAEQLRSDLFRLFQLESPEPLQTWLKNAADLTSYLPSVSAHFRTIAARLAESPTRAATRSLSAPAGPTRFDAFLIYSPDQADAAEALADDLEARGRRVFLDRRALPPGQDWDALTEDAQRQSRADVWMVNGISRDAATRSLLERPEVLRAIDRGRMIAVFPDALSARVGAMLLPHGVAQLDQERMGTPATLDAIERHIDAQR